jgi:uncharacterized protein YwgA
MELGICSAPVIKNNMHHRANDIWIIMFSSRSRLEKKIKDLNAIMAQYRKRIEEADRRLIKKDMAPEEAERVKAKCRRKMESIAEKIRAVRAELDAIK